MNKNDNNIDYSTINHDLLERYFNGEFHLKNEIIEINIPLVKMIANQYCKKTNLSYEDLFQEGCIGLIEAVDKYDISKKIKFSTYLSSCVIGKIKNYICNNRYKSFVPKYLKDRISMYDYYKSCDMSEDEIRLKMGLGGDNFKNFKEKYTIVKKIKFISLEEKVYCDDSSEMTVGDLCESENDDPINNVFVEEFRIALKKALSVRDYKIICARFGIGCKQMTQQEVGDLYKMTSQNVGKIERRTIKKLGLNYNMVQFNNNI